jgi:parvulin-like peptidyl-prolyl isomerase
MKNIPLALAVAVSMWVSQNAGVAGQTSRGAPRGAVVVARVNGEPVSRAEFQRMLGNPVTRSELQQERGVENPDPKELERLALRKVIHHRLMIQEAVRRKIAISTEELDSAIAALRRRFEDLESLGRWMKEQGLDDQSLFETIRGDMMTARVWGLLVEGVRITEQEAQRYYASHKEDLMSGEEIRLRIIAVKDKAAADGILASLKRGASFSHLARLRSVGLRAANGGDTGWVDSRTLPAPLQKVVPLLKVGDVGGPLENASGQFLIVGLEGRRPIRARTLAEARPEIERRLLPALRQAVVTTWLTEQEKKAKIEVLAPN